METKSYALLRDGSGWAFSSPEELSATYATIGAALIDVFAAIEKAVEEGDAVELKIPGQRQGKRLSVGFVREDTV